jgi:hypothetical protein
MKKVIIDGKEYLLVNEQKLREMFKEYDMNVFEGKPARIKDFVESFCHYFFKGK